MKAIDVAAGLIGGLAGSLAMNLFQASLAKVEDGAPNQHESQKDEPATAKTADAVSRTVLGHSLSKQQKAQAEPWVHYLFGGLTGAAYGAAASAWPQTETGAGTVYGSAVWLFADEIGVPAAGLAKPPQEVALSTHLMALASHLVYGVTLFGVSRAIRKIA